MLLYFQFAMPDQQLEDLPVAYELVAVATARLVPLPEPELGSGFA